MRIMMTGISAVLWPAPLKSSQELITGQEHRARIEVYRLGTLLCGARRATHGRTRFKSPNFCD
jgi:hypothetical protein